MTDTGAVVPTALEVLGAEDLGNLGVIARDREMVAEIYARREAGWVELSHVGFARLAAVEAENTDLRERVAWLEAVAASADAIVSSRIQELRVLVQELIDRDERGS